MFDLSRAISNWRNTIVASGIRPDALEELESHLLDEIEQRIGAGVGEEDAFHAAVALLGDVASLNAEFGKLQGPDPAPARFVKVFYFGASVFVAIVNTWTLLAYDLRAWQCVLGITAVLLIALYLVKLPFLLRSLSPAAYLRLARCIKAAANLVWLWAIYAVLEAEHILPAQLGLAPSMFIWCLCAAISLSFMALVLSSPRFPGKAGGGSLSLSDLVPIPPSPPSRHRSEAERLTKQLDPAAREIIAAAGAEAARLGHEYIGTEHVLLGLLTKGWGPFSMVLQSLKLERESVRLEVENQVLALQPSFVRPDLPFTPRAARALRLAAREAGRQKRDSAGPEHILLGLALEGGGVAAKVLHKLGIRATQLRAEIQKPCVA
ncbi:MAG TPA: Clp protease N-terminal domain-containing protein [Verrucomicrobiae bacterium]|nr:Clp protease N-terminal domain-containing protein [Verrucomicrobiae bacterium]